MAGLADCGWLHRSIMRAYILKHFLTQPDRTFDSEFNLKIRWLTNFTLVRNVDRWDLSIEIHEMLSRGRNNLHIQNWIKVFLSLYLLFCAHTLIDIAFHRYSKLKKPRRDVPRSKLRIALISLSWWITMTKETTLERADFTLELWMFVTAEKEREMLIIFFLLSFCQLLSPQI